MLPDSWLFLDGVTGNELGRLEYGFTGTRVCSGRYPTPVTVEGARLVARREGQAPVTLATDVTSRSPWCATSDDSQQVAYIDSSGQVHLLSIASGRQLGQRSATGLRSLLFSSHGLVIVRQGWLDILGGPEGEFSIALPEQAFAAQISLGTLAGVAVSPDGHLVVVARIGSSRADVIDLRTRVVRGTVHYGAGWPRFAVSLDGSRVIAAGLRGASRLGVWRLPADEAPTGHPGSWAFWSASFSLDGRRMAIVNRSRSMLEIYGDQGELLASSPVPGSALEGSLVRGGAVALSEIFQIGELSLRDVEHNRDIWKRPCRLCYRFQISEDGSRAVLLRMDGLEVWDSRVDRVLFTEPRRLAGMRTGISLSPDGRSVVWTEGAVAHVREVDAGEERSFQLDSPGRLVSFSPDSRQFAVTSSASLSLWDAVAGRARWTVPHLSSENPVAPRWSADARALLVWDGLGTEVFDSETGARLARFPATGAMASFVRPDLRARLIASESNWDFRPLPQPTPSPRRRASPERSRRPVLPWRAWRSSPPRRSESAQRRPTGDHSASQPLDQRAETRSTPRAWIEAEASSLVRGVDREWRRRRGAVRRRR